MSKHSLRTKVTTTLGDLTTPVAAFLRIREHFPDAVLFESADFQGGKKEFSYLCFDTLALFELRRDGLRTEVQGQAPHHETMEEIAPEKKNILASFITRMLASYREVDPAPPGILNGFFGYCSFDAIEYAEDIVLHAPVVEAEDIPLAHYRLFRHSVAFDHQKQQLHFLQNALDGEVTDDSRKIVALITNATYRSGSFRLKGESTSELSDETHSELILRCQEHIARGDVFQIVPSRKYRQQFSGDDFQVYRALRTINPSPYLFYFKTKDFTLLGSSPEAQIEIKGDFATISPIAGTYPRSGNDEEDQAAAARLLQDPKESAEHVMLVDLARNDLSIHCYPVAVTRFKYVEFYSHVIHLVSKVRGALLDKTSSAKVFAATSPAGTLSGAPKYKAMQLLDRHESSRRHFYGGAIGLLSLNGDINHAIMIRTMLSKNGTLFSQSGSGVVADSVPECEVAEVKNKLAALRAAAVLAEKL